MSAPSPIDVWNLASFDQALLDTLNSERIMLRDHAQTETRQFREREAAAWAPAKSNLYSGERNAFIEHVVMPMMEERTIRAWHHTRLTDDETGLLKAEGVHLANLETIRRRLDAQVSRNVLTAAQADGLYAASPFRHQGETRSGRFWMSACPHPTTNDSGIEPLIQHWGGESIYFELDTRPELAELVELVRSVGLSRVVELAVPLSATRHSLRAATAVVDTLVRSLGCDAEWSDFDVCVRRALGPEAVLKIHTEGEPEFAALARGYPSGFVNPRG